MSAEANEDVVRRHWYEELWGKWNIAAADELFAADDTLHVTGSPVPVDRDGAKGVVSMFGAAFRGLTHTVDEIIAEGNTVAAVFVLIRRRPASGCRPDESAVAPHAASSGRTEHAAQT